MVSVFRSGSSKSHFCTQKCQCSSAQKWDFELFFVVEKSPKGGEVIFYPKNYIADFVGFKAVHFGRKFWKTCPKRGGGGGGHLQSKKNHCKFTHVLQIFWKKVKCNFQKGTRGGGKAVWKFSKKTSIFIQFHFQYSGKE